MFLFFALIFLCLCLTDWCGWLIVSSCENTAEHLLTKCICVCAFVTVYSQEVDKHTHVYFIYNLMLIVMLIWFDGGRPVHEHTHTQTCTNSCMNMLLTSHLCLPWKTINLELNEWNLETEYWTTHAVGSSCCCSLVTCNAWCADMELCHMFA